MSDHLDNTENTGLLVVVSGFSGAGKSVLMKKLMQTSDRYAYSVSATTRQPRAGERDGKDYFFIDKEAFEKMIQNGDLLEYNQYVDNYYGTPKQYVMEQIKNGKDVILEIDVNGARQVKQNFPEAVTIFITAPSAEELAGRLKKRGTEKPEVVKKRLEAALKETDEVKKYDYLIINDDLEETVKRLDRLITEQHNKASLQDAYLEKFKKDMKEILEDQ